jgi:hypothetical protein
MPKAPEEATWVFVVADDGIQGHSGIDVAASVMEPFDVREGVYSAAYLADGTILEMSIETERVERAFRLTQILFGKYLRIQEHVRLGMVTPKRLDPEALSTELRKHLAYLRINRPELGVRDPSAANLTELVNQYIDIETQPRRWFWRRRIGRTQL